MNPQIGKTYKVKTTPQGKVSSNGPGTRPADGECKLKITRKLNSNNNGQMYQGIVIECDPTVRALGYNVGHQYNIYDYELVLGPYNKEAIEKEIADINEKKTKLDSEVSELNHKIEWMETIGVSEFDEDEFKVYRTLSLLEDDNVGKIEKMKEIAKLIKQ